MMRASFRTWSRHLYRLPPLMFRLSYGKPYGYTYMPVKSFSTCSENRYATHFLYQYRQTRTLGYQANNNNNELVGDKKKKKDDTNAREEGGGGCGAASHSDGAKSNSTEGGWFRGWLDSWGSGEGGEGGDCGSSCGGCGGD